MQTIDHLEVAKEAVSILRGEHPGWKGDRYLNAETFLQQVGQDFGMAAAFADDMQANAADFSDLIGVSPDRVRWMANRVREGIARAAGPDALTQYYRDRNASGQAALAGMTR